MSEKISGFCGKCVWEYKTLDDDSYVLEIAPEHPECGGILSGWGYLPPWSYLFLASSTTKVKIFPGVKARTCEQMFAYFHVLKEADISDLDVSGVIDMNDMFYGCSSLISLDVSSWNVSNVADVREMFCGCKALTSLDVSNWNVSKVLYMSSMFENCSSLTSLDVSSWNVSHVKNMRDMFRQCHALTSLDISAWDICIDDEDMEGMFWGCDALISPDVGLWGAPKISEKDGGKNDTTHD